MGRYCSVEQVQARFRKVTDVTSYPSAVDSHYIYYAEGILDQRLASSFTVPFSSNNLTATDLAIDLTYAKIIIYDDPKKYASIMSEVDKRIDDLIVGSSTMILSDGTTLERESGLSGAWSNTMSCDNIFTLEDYDTTSYGMGF